MKRKKNPVFVFTVTVNRGRSHWLYITYQHIYQGISNTLCYNLWLKTNSENFEAFTEKKQLKQVKKVEIEGERSRVELTWFPEYKDRFLFSELPAQTPDFNSMYQSFVITDRATIKTE
ncbi:hypothetical protein [Fusibacter sp. JL216-2]|uniref:hypothetical protein n=1 Tax=Fusibacter sp. JL216-2 TaxID=3071453 RepID=UPI003D34BCDF